jgi:ectoine hydroxylase-related dioxygenase (phytanoyl-CoA dioxygenase family)
MNQAKVEEYREQGFVVVEHVLDPVADIEPLVFEYSEQLDGMIEGWYDDGQISSKYDDLSFGERAAAVMREGLSVFPDFDISLPFKIAPETEIHLGPEVFRLLRNPRILDFIEELIGPEIYCSPVQHTRIKPPEDLVPKELRNSLTASVGWHQDAGVVQPEADETDMVSVWVAITEVTLENSCLWLLPGSHRGQVALHCYDYAKEGAQGFPQLAIPERFRDPVAVPVPMHNVSDDWRWSFDLRYNPIGMPTGRDWFPGFVARSQEHPETELHDPLAWKQLWLDAHANLLASQMPEFLRWQHGDPRCA